MNKINIIVKNLAAVCGWGYGKSIQAITDLDRVLKCLNYNKAEW